MKVTKWIIWIWIGLVIGGDNGENGIEEDKHDEMNHFMSFEEWKEWKQRNMEHDIVVEEVENKQESIKTPETEQGRVYKDRFNYALAECAATVVKTNSDAKGALSILSEVKDSYLVNKCSSENKFVVVELCQDILVSQIVMGNFELFSSLFRRVRFSVSDSFPVGGPNGWHVLTEVEAANVRDVQHFTVENPKIWARYLKIDILLHYGNEFYCPVSLLRVHGTTMMEEFKRRPRQENVSVTVDECPVTVPHLALDEFLREFNHSAFCEAGSTKSTKTALPGGNTAGTQESIFKNIVNRLTLLENNASLSLLYVEEQSRLLSAAFARLDSRHSARFSALIAHFNQTVAAHVAFFHHAYRDTRRHSVALLDRHRAILANVLNDAEVRHEKLVAEVTFYKWLGYVNLILLGVVIFRIPTIGIGNLTEAKNSHESPCISARNSSKNHGTSNRPNSRPRGKNSPKKPKTFPRGARNFRAKNFAAKFRARNSPNSPNLSIHRNSQNSSNSNIVS